MAIIAPQVAFSISMFSFGLSYLARTNERKAALDVIEQERDQKGNAKRQKILQDAIDSVVNLHVSVLNAASFVNTIKSNANRASKVIEKKRGLKDLADSNKEDIDFHDLINKLDTLQRAAGEILKNIGEDGINPISLNVDELVSNTQALQTIDKGEITFEEAMKTQLSLHPKPSGNFSSPPQAEQSTQEFGDPDQAKLVAEQ